MSHEQSETIQLPSGKWINIYGANTPQSGQQLPGTPQYDTVEAAVSAAGSRSRSAGATMANPISLTEAVKRGYGGSGLTGDWANMLIPLDDGSFLIPKEFTSYTHPATTDTYGDVESYTEDLLGTGRLGTGNEGAGQFRSYWAPPGSKQGFGGWTPDQEAEGNWSRSGYGGSPVSMGGKGYVQLPTGSTFYGQRNPGEASPDLFEQLMLAATKGFLGAGISSGFGLGPLADKGFTAGTDLADASEASLLGESAGGGATSFPVDLSEPTQFNLNDTINNIGGSMDDPTSIFDDVWPDISDTGIPDISDPTGLGGAYETWGQADFDAQMPGMWDTIKDTWNSIPTAAKSQLGKILFGTAGTGGGGGSGGGQRGLFSDLINSYFGAQGQGQYGKEIGEAMKYAVDKADPFAAQRPYYQGQLKQMYEDPEYFNKSSLLQGANRNAINDTTRALSAQGYNMSGNVPMEVGQRLQNNNMNYALNLMNQTGGYAGGGFGPGQAGTIAGTMGQQQAQSNLKQQGYYG